MPRGTLLQGPISAKAFLFHGEEIINSKKKKRTKSSAIRRRRFRANFGATPEICSYVWLQILHSHKNDPLPENAGPKHLLWGLYLLKVYGTEASMAGSCGADEQTIRYWSWLFVEEVSKLAKTEIRWKDRLRFDNGSFAKVTVDGTDFRTPCYGGPKNMPIYKLHKTKSPCLRYEVGVAIQSGDIVHINGPFPAAKYADISNFRNHLKKKLRLGYELVEADDGYRGEPLLIELPGMDGGGGKAQIKAKSRARGRHENCNSRFKQWGALRDLFRHSEEQHGYVFKAIAVLEQIDIRTGPGQDEVEYRTMLTPVRKKNLRMVRKQLSRGQIRRTS